MPPFSRLRCPHMIAAGVVQVMVGALWCAILVGEGRWADWPWFVVWAAVLSLAGLGACTLVAERAGARTRLGVGLLGPMTFLSIVCVVSSVARRDMGAIALAHGALLANLLFVPSWVGILVGSMRRRWAAVIRTDRDTHQTVLPGGKRVRKGR